MVDDKRQDRGQAIVLVLAVVVVAVVCTVAMAGFSARLVDKQQAQLAADAAALAGVVGGRVAADELATANEGVLTMFEVRAGDVLVEVRVGDEVAQARATRAP
ncbi:MAG: helicase/secretion neighborhood TadE-like protein [Ilumatobacteraceae bacterium]